MPCARADRGCIQQSSCEKLTEHMSHSETKMRRISHSRQSKTIICMLYTFNYISQGYSTLSTALLLATKDKDMKVPPPPQHYNVPCQTQILFKNG